MFENLIIILTDYNADETISVNVSNISMLKDDGEYGPMHEFHTLIMFGNNNVISVKELQPEINDKIDQEKIRINKLLNL